jgi:hypothetical protein
MPESSEDMPAQASQSGGCPPDLGPLLGESAWNFAVSTEAAHRCLDHLGGWLDPCWNTAPGASWGKIALYDLAGVQNPLRIKRLLYLPHHFDCCGQLVLQITHLSQADPVFPRAGPIHR